LDEKAATIRMAILAVAVLEEFQHSSGGDHLAMLA
jgi:hypothetical protein